MKFKYTFYLLVTFLATLQLWAQVPLRGTYGDPVVYIGFGSEPSNDGPELEDGMTTYSYITDSGLPYEGSYMIKKGANLPNSSETITDHSGGGGYMMLVNSGNSPTNYFYKNTVSGLCSGTTFQVSAWINNLVVDQNNSSSRVTFTVEDTNGRILKTYNIGDIGAGWNQYPFEFTTVDSPTVVIKMSSEKVGTAPGNPIAIDDIIVRAFSSIPIYANTEIAGVKYQEICLNRGVVLSASVGWRDGIQWQVSSNDNGNTWTDISGGTRRQYNLFYEKIGTYRYRVANFDLSNISNPNCRVYSGEVTINVIEPIYPIVQVTQPSCDVPTGTITITEPTGLMYSIDGINYQPEMVFSNLPGKNYTVRVSSGDCGIITNNVHINSFASSNVLTTATVVQPTICNDPFGTITITTSNAEYSFDDGQTWQNTNVKSGLILGDYIVKTRNSSLCESLPATVTIFVPPGYPSTPTVTVTQPDCFIKTGTITVSDIAPAYSFDGGTTWQTSNSKSNLLPGTYQVLIKNNLGCNSLVAKEVVINTFVSQEPLPTAVSQQVFCFQDSTTLGNIAISGQDMKWYDAPSSGNLLPVSTLISTGTYYVTQTISNCESERTPIPVIVQNTPAPTGKSTQVFCFSQEATVSLLEATGTVIAWYDKAVNGTVFDNATPLMDGKIYYAVQIMNGCESVNRLPVTVQISRPTVIVNEVTATFCDDLNDGVEIIDLTSYNRSITLDTSVQIGYYKSLVDAKNKNVSGVITSATKYNIKTGTTILYARIDSNDKCYQVVKMEMALFSKTVIPIIDVIPVCSNSNVTIDAGSGFDSYLWSTGATSESIIVDKIGSYSVTVTQNHGNIICSSTKAFSVVLSNAATISKIETQDWTDNENTITVEITDASIGDYEYSVNGISYQESNTFTGLRSGEYLVYVRDKNGCGITNQEVFLLSYPKYFTPNGDGYNDTWGVKFSESEPGLNIKIFNRYGKLIRELNATSTWDGTLNGRELPSADYWFVITRANGTVSKGHFAMKR